MSETNSSQQPQQSTEDNTVNLKVVNQVNPFLFFFLFQKKFDFFFSFSKDGNEVVFKIKRHTQLRKLMEAYCGRQGVDISSIRFLYDGQRVQPDQTPKEVKILSVFFKNLLIFLKN